MTSAQPNPQFDLLTLSAQMADRFEQIEPAIVAVNAGAGQRDRCAASGLIWADNTVVTVDQAIRREEDLTVLLADGSTVAATVVGRDSSTDLAVLQLQSAPNLPRPQFSSLPLRLGQLVLAAGRSSQGSLNASMGMIGRLGGSWRSWQGGQIDQLIRPSLISAASLTGSTLFNLQGQVIGLNTTGPRHSTLTLPFATIQRVVDQLLQTGRIARGYLGVAMQSVLISERLAQTLCLSQATGVIMLSVEPDSPADRAGILVGDILIALEAQPVTEVGEVRLMLGAERVGQTLTVQLIRGGALVELAVTVGER
ncbi:MAG: S1C family serine protease [Elainella sp.]